MTAGRVCIMSPANKAAIVQIIACLFLLAGLSAKLLGIPETWQSVPFIVGAVMFLLFIRMQKKAKAERERSGQPAPVAPLAARKKLFWITALSLIVGSVGTLPLLPYTVDNFQPWIYYWVIPGQIVFLGLFLPFLWKKWTNTPDEAQQK
jgi:amino acid transporter